MSPRILVFAGTARSGSAHTRLAALAAKELTLAEADVTLISLADYPLPIHDGERDAPENAVKLKRQMCAHQGVFIVSPEINASVTPMLKNTIDWISRVREAKETPLAAYRNRAFALAAAASDHTGGVRALIALRQILEVGCGALVIPDEIAVAEAERAFDDMDNLRDERCAAALRTAAQRLTEMAQLYA